MVDGATVRRTRSGCGRLFYYLAGLLFATSCGGNENPDHPACLVSTDCPAGQTCNLGRCSTTGSGPPPSVSFDAGASPLDPVRLPGTDASVSTCPEFIRCEDINAECGVIEDGCDGFIDCGECVAPETCGGDGEPNRCGGDGETCTPSTCQSLGAECGFVEDGCSDMLDCGVCTTGVCGGGGTPNECGGSSCTPGTCQSLGAECGDLGDGCSGSLACGGCPPGRYCNNNQCQCDRKTCADLGADCGNPDDGCGTPLDCGNCTAPETCGGEGKDFECGCTRGPVATDFKVFKRARNVSAGANTVGWDDIAAARSLDGRGTSIEVRGYCRYEGGGGGGCGCCARLERRTATSQYLLLDDADLSIPNAPILGVEVELTGRRVGENPTLTEIALVGSAVSGNRARTITWPTGYQPFTFGGPTDRWLRSWTRDELRANEFGVRIQMRASATCFSGGNCPRTAAVLDGARVRVWYEGCL